MNGASDIRADPPQSSGTFVAEHNLETTRKRRRHSPALAAYVRSTDRVHAAKHGMKPSDRSLVLDGASRIPERQELEQRDHSVLRLDKRPDPLGPVWGT